MSKFRWRITLRSVCIMSALLLVAGCGDRGNDAADDYSDTVKIEGHVRTTQVLDGASVVTTFVGPPTEDLRSAVTAPGVSIGDSQLDRILNFDVVGEGSFRYDGVSCDLLLQRLADGATPSRSLRLSREQEASVRAGKLEVVQVSVACDEDAPASTA